MPGCARSLQLSGLAENSLLTGKKQGKTGVFRRMSCPYWPEALQNKASQRDSLSKLTGKSGPTNREISTPFREFSLPPALKIQDHVQGGNQFIKGILS